MTLIGMPEESIALPKMRKNNPSENIQKRFLFIYGRASINAELFRHFVLKKQITYIPSLLDPNPWYEIQ